MRFFVRYKSPGPLKPTANPYPSRIFPLKQKALGIAFILSLSMGAVLRFFPSVYDFSSSLLFEVTASIHIAFSYPFARAREFLSDSYTFLNLESEHLRLLQENKNLKWRLQALEPLQHENKALKQELNIPMIAPYRHMAARIVSTPYDGLHYVFLIAAGTHEGLKKDQAVVGPEGILGRIEKIGRHVSRVLLVADVNSRIPIITETSGQKAILAGERGDLPLLIYIPDTQNIKVGERVLTSGTGGIFPPGLPVGRVDDIANGKIRVRPFAFYKNLEWVHILQPQPITLREDILNTSEKE